MLSKNYSNKLEIDNSFFHAVNILQTKEIDIESVVLNKINKIEYLKLNCNENFEYIKKFIEKYKNDFDNLVVLEVDKPQVYNIREILKFKISKYIKITSIAKNPCDIHKAYISQKIMSYHENTYKGLNFDYVILKNVFYLSSSVKEFYFYFTILNENKIYRRKKRNIDIKNLPHLECLLLHDFEGTLYKLPKTLTSLKLLFSDKHCIKSKTNKNIENIVMSSCDKKVNKGNIFYCKNFRLKMKYNGQADYFASTNYNIHCENLYLELSHVFSHYSCKLDLKIENIESKNITIKPRSCNWDHEIVNFISCFVEKLPNKKKYKKLIFETNNKTKNISNIYFDDNKNKLNKLKIKTIKPDNYGFTEQNVSSKILETLKKCKEKNIQVFIDDINIIETYFSNLL